MNDVQLTLWAAQMLILDRRDWTQHTMFRRTNGCEVYTADEAACYCGYGALMAVREVDCDPYLHLNAAVNESFPIWQDRKGRKHADVIAAFDRAIDLAGEP